MRGHHGHLIDESQGSRGMDLLRSTLPFRLLRRDGKVVGCWYTTDARPGDPDFWELPGPVTCVVYRGMVRTEDDRIAGICGSMPLTPGFVDDMLRMLSEASRDKWVVRRRSINEAFVAGVRDADLRVSAPPSGERIEADLRALSALDDGRGGQHDESEMRVALSRFHDARTRVLSRFLHTLDPLLVEALRSRAGPVRGTHQLDAILGEAWPLMDRTFERRAPLQATVLPVMHDLRRVRRALRPHLPSMRKESDDVTTAVDPLMEERMRPFLPEVRTDLTALASPGFG